MVTVRFSVSRSCDVKIINNGGRHYANVYRFLLSSDNDYITFKFIRVSEMILSKLWLYVCTSLMGMIRAGIVTMTMQITINMCAEPLTNKTLNLIQTFTLALLVNS